MARFHHITAWLSCFLLLIVAESILQAQNLKEITNASELSIYSDTGEYDLTQDEIHLLKGKNRIIFGQVQMKAQEIWFNQKTLDFKAIGDVEIKLDDGTSWATTSVSGNLDTKQLQFKEYGFDGLVWHSGGESGSNTPDGHKSLDGAWLSTCDEWPPHYKMYASHIDHYPDNTFTAKHILLKAGPVPIFYFPYAWGSTDNSQGMIIKPGHSGKRGAYLQLGRIWQLEEDDFTKTYVDLMTKRGIALGHETELSSDVRELGLKLYGLFDRDPPETEDGFNRRFDEEHDRYRVNLFYAYHFTDYTHAWFNLDLLSDIDMLENWFKHDYKDILQPKSYFAVTQDTDIYSLNATVRPRINDFYTVVETLPEIKFDLHRMGIGNSPFRYQSSNSFGYYSMKWRNFYRKRWELVDEDIYEPELHTDPGDYSAFRADTTHFVYLPLEYDDVLDFIPRAGIKATYYSQSSRQRITQRDLADMFIVDDPDRVYNNNTVKHYDRDGGDVTRLAYELGAELRSSAYSDWKDISLDPFEGQGLRHVLLPFINYTFAPDPSHDRDYLYFFDETDRLERQHFVRLGIDQLLQTRFENQVRTLARWQNYVDFHFDRGEESGRHPGDFGSRLDVYPVSWLTLWTAILHDIGEGDIQRGEFGTRFGEEDKLNLALRYIYRNDHLSRSVYSMGSTLTDITGESSYYKRYFETSDTITTNLHLPCGSKTSFDIEAEYDFEKHALSEHKYIINRDLHCWIVSFGVGWDNGDFEVMLMFRLSAFPKVKIDLNL